MQVLCFFLLLSFKNFSPQSQVKNWDKLWLNVVYLGAQLADFLISKPSSNIIVNSYHSDKMIMWSSPTSLYMNSKVNIIKSIRVSLDYFILRLIVPLLESCWFLQFRDALESFWFIQFLKHFKIIAVPVSIIRCLKIQISKEQEG